MVMCEPRVKTLSRPSFDSIFMSSHANYGVASVFQFANGGHALTEIYLRIFVENWLIFHEVVDRTLRRRFDHRLHVLYESQDEKRLAASGASTTDGREWVFKR